MNIFSQNDYRKILHDQALKLKRNGDSDFNFGVIAKKCQLQSSYLSKVFKKEAHVNDDQLFLLVEYLRFKDEESRFIELLFKFQKSHLPQRRRKIKELIREIKNKNLKTENHLLADVVTKDDQSAEDYFLQPKLQIIHFLLGLKKYRTNQQLILQVLNISKKQYDIFLKELIRLQLIKKSEKGITVLRKHFFLSKESPIVPIYHTLMKSNAFSRLQGLSPDEKYSLSLLFHGSEDNFDFIRNKLINVLKEAEKETTSESKPKEVFQLSIDLFPWT